MLHTYVKVLHTYSLYKFKPSLKTHKEPQWFSYNTHIQSAVMLFIIWLTQMTHADWLISGLEKVILPAQESHLAFSRNSSCLLV